MRWSQLSTNILLALCAARLSPKLPPETVQERLGYVPTARLLVIHADDFGMNHSVNRATSEALENHWITSASILVPCPWFLEAASFAKTHPTRISAFIRPSTASGLPSAGDP